MRLALVAAATLAFAPASASAQAAPAASAPTAPAPAVDPERAQLGRELGMLLNSEAMARMQLRKMLAETLPAGFAANPEMAELEKRYPGIIRAITDAMAPVMTDYVIRSLPELGKRSGVIFAEGLTSAELGAALAFYRSATGSRIIQLMGEETDFTAVLRSAARAPDEEISQADLAAGIEAGASGTIARLTPAERADTERFMMSPAGRKFGPLSVRVQTLAAEFVNQDDPVTDAAIEKVVMEAMTGFMAREDAKK